MALNLSQSTMMAVAVKHSSSMAVPVHGAVNCIAKSSIISVRKSHLFSCRRAFSAVDKIKVEGDLEEVEQEEEEEQDYRGTPYVPVYVMLPFELVHMDYGLHVFEEVRMLASMKVDGVKVECWWGSVEALAPKHYDWSKYKTVFRAARNHHLKLQVVMCFHGCGDGDGVHIPLPRWVMEVGRKDPDIFFTDRDGRRNYDCLTWGIDHCPVLMNRSAIQVYRDFMKNFCQEFDEFFVDGSITGIEIGLGPSGELQFPFHNATCSWEYPAIEEFQCYDKYMMKSLKKAWEERGEPWCGIRPTTYKYSYKGIDLPLRNHMSFYARFFLSWYSTVLVDHADMLLSLAKSSLLHHCTIAAKIPGICNLWYENEIDAPNSDAPIISVLKKYSTAISSKCSELRIIDHGNGKDFPQKLADEIGGMHWQVLYAAWGAGIPIAGENDFPCYDKREYREILEMAKPSNDPIGRHLTSFTYRTLSPKLKEKHNLREFGRFVRRMHGDKCTT